MTLPAPFLKGAFLTYNRIKILTIDKLLFPEYAISEDKFLLYRKKCPFRESAIPVEYLPEGAAGTYMQGWYDWTEEEFILITDRACCIEPDHGWALVGGTRLIYYSLGVSRTWFQPKPGFLKFIFKRKIEHVEKIISLRDTGEENYFHFFNDVLSKLHFLQISGVDTDNATVVIARRLWDKPYFKYVFGLTPFLQSFKWLVQEDQYISCRTAIFCKPRTHRMDLWSAILSPFRGRNDKMPSFEKVFLTRSKSRLRFIENHEEIESICVKKGFRVVDADLLTPQQQVEIFSAVRILIGIHGAGLTNMVFMRPACKVLEIFGPPTEGYLPYHYIMLAHMSGLEYSALIGEPERTRYSGGFHVNTEQLELDLMKFE